MISFPVELASVSWEGLSLKTPVWNFSGFFPGVEQGARIALFEKSFSGIVEHLAPIINELFLLYRSGPVSAFLDILDFSPLSGITNDDDKVIAF